MALESACSGEGLVAGMPVVGTPVDSGEYTMQQEATEIEGGTRRT